MTPPGVEQVGRRDGPARHLGLELAVNPTMTPPGVEQVLHERTIECGGLPGVNPTMTPPGVEQESDAKVDG